MSPRLPSKTYALRFREVNCPNSVPAIQESADSKNANFVYIIHEVLQLRFAFFAAIFLAGCSTNEPRLQKPADANALVYFGFDDHSEKPEDVARLAETWGESKHKVCPHWQATVSEKDADYKVLFGAATVTIVGRRGEVVYGGGIGPLYLPHGNPDGSGINICKLTGEMDTGPRR